jgi:2-polyprenyl-3-methyl-5-hydroxy-6-metoxy-1,4-benzoquinol methylase
MVQAVSQHREYAPGHSKNELDRLSRQAEAFEPFTRQLFQQAGISKGMRVLDVGCGSGDISFLVAELVGQTGEVIGADRASEAVERATARAKAKNLRNVTFLEGDPAELQFDRPFDAVVGRFVLMYYPDPVATIRKLRAHLRPRGLVVFQEFDIPNSRSIPPAPTYERLVGLIGQTLTATGARMQLGLELYSVYQAAGLPGPSMRIDALIGGGPDYPSYELLADVTRSLLPVMEKLKIATAAEIDLPTLAQRMRDEVVASEGITISPALIGAWSRNAKTTS